MGEYYFNIYYIRTCIFIYMQLFVTILISYNGHILSFTVLNLGIYLLGKKVSQCLSKVNIFLFCVSAPHLCFNLIL